MVAVQQQAVCLCRLSHGENTWSHGVESSALVRAPSTSQAPHWGTSMTNCHYHHA